MMQSYMSYNASELVYYLLVSKHKYQMVFLVLLAHLINYYFQHYCLVYVVIIL